MVEPGDPFQSGELDVLETPPRPTTSDHFCLVEADHRFDWSSRTNLPCFLQMVRCLPQLTSRCNESRYWADSTDHRNTSSEVLAIMDGKRRRSDRAGREKLNYPGRPSVAKVVELRQFWVAIAAGCSGEDAAAIVASMKSDKEGRAQRRVGLKRG